MVQDVIKRGQHVIDLVVQQYNERGKKAHKGAIAPDWIF